MGSFNEMVGVKVDRLPNTFVDAVKMFSLSVLGAVEIDYVDVTPENYRAQTKYPTAFYIANLSINHLLEEVREQLPNKCPIVKDYSKNENEKKKKDEQDKRTN